MADGAFDIYQTATGYAAVTNPVQRQILDALRERERQLPELVELTGRSKPTLSSLHMRELLNRALIAEATHPADSRRKVYRLLAAKIGSSDLPVERLKEAVQRYAALVPGPGAIPLPAVFDALDATEATAEALHAQGRRLGAASASFLKAATARDLWMRLAAFLEGENLAIPQRIDLEGGAIELKLGPASRATPARMAAILAGFAEGLARAASLGMKGVRGTAIVGGIKLWAV